jgi:hypothetical protein
VAVQLWGHKLLRLGLGPLAHLLLLAQAIRASGRSPLALAFSIAHLLAAAAVSRQARGRSLAAPERTVAQVMFLQATAVGGIARFATGRRPALWPKVDRSSRPEHPLL